MTFRPSPAARGRADIQNFINLAAAILLFLSPFVLHYDRIASRSAWGGGLIVAILAIVAMVQFAEWEEWVEVLLGAILVAWPWILAFNHDRPAVLTFVILGAIVALASILEIWQVHRDPNYIGGSI